MQDRPKREDVISLSWALLVKCGRIAVSCFGGYETGDVIETGACEVEEHNVVTIAAEEVVDAEIAVNNVQGVDVCEGSCSLVLLPIRHKKIICLLRKGNRDEKDRTGHEPLTFVSVQSELLDGALEATPRKIFE